VLYTSELIKKKRDGSDLSVEEIGALVRGISNQSVSDSQIAAFAMAVWFRGMSVREQSALTLAMRDSGTSLDWSGLNGPVLDKHSTGGVGDLVSLLLGPMVAACGGHVPMISGRGLGHTGGTLDKLESIPGFSTNLDISQFQKLVAEVGICIIGQTEKLAPADRRLYAVRDVTATVSSIPLIVSSILSKKLAEGLDALVMDVKVGSGAFMQDMHSARELAQAICHVSEESGLPCNALITDMDQPLAWSAGNGLEVMEAIAFLSGEKQHDRLYSVVMALSAELLVLSGLNPDKASAIQKLESVLHSGAAAESFSRMVYAQGGAVDLIEQPEKYLGTAPVINDLTADCVGYVEKVDVHGLGVTVVHLGGGRLRAKDVLDHTVGLASICQPGMKLEPDTPMATIHARTQQDWDQAAATLRDCIKISEQAPGQGKPPVCERIVGAATP
jgi:thymidine phosphorylase